jgi:hypothetical protein
MIYLVIRHDRHYDDQITAHATLVGVDAAVAAFEAEYGDRYRWHDLLYRVGRGHSVLRGRATDHDDGPSVTR